MHRASKNCHHSVNIRGGSFRVWLMDYFKKCIDNVTRISTNKRSSGSKLKAMICEPALSTRAPHTQDIILIDQIPNFAKLNWMHSCFCVIANRWTLSSRMDSFTGRAMEKNQWWICSWIAIVLQGATNGLLQLHVNWFVFRSRSKSHKSRNCILSESYIYFLFWKELARQKLCKLRSIRTTTTRGMKYKPAAVTWGTVDLNFNVDTFFVSLCLL